MLQDGISTWDAAKFFADIIKKMTKFAVDEWNKCLNVSLKQDDPEIFELIEKEKWRQFSCLELIASENFTSQVFYRLIIVCY